MQKETTIPEKSPELPAKKYKYYLQLLKFRLSTFVVLSGALGFFTGSRGDIHWLNLAALTVGSFLITGAANTINQIAEKDFDKLMKRTQNRPLPLGALGVKEAVIYTIALAVSGALLLYFTVGFSATWLSLLSLFLYGFVYTPLKRLTPISVFVGAFPGALPPLIGYVAASGKFGLEGGLLFLIQFVWQFPHFWAIAWLGDEDYKKAGFQMLPYGEKNIQTALQITVYTIFLIPAGLTPWYFGLSGVISAVIATICGVLFVGQAFYLLKKRTNDAALKLMFGSFFYLPVVLTTILWDKI
jgi:protoheme IX farnesyltransferase